MLRKIGQLTLLGSVSLLAGLAQANTEMAVDTTMLEDNIIFQTIPDIRDIACTPPLASGFGLGPLPRATPATYTLKNLSSSSYKLSDVDLIVEGTNLTSMAIAVSSICVDGYVLAGGATCDIDIAITQPTCVSGPMRETVNAELHIGINSSQQPELNDAINFDITPIGSGADFAALGSHVVNSSTVGIAQIIGNLGGTAVMPTASQFNIQEGVITGTSGTDPVTKNANQDLTAAQDTFRWAKSLDGCSLFDVIVGPPFDYVGFGDYITPGYYCLNVLAPFFLVPTVAGTITLDGPGDFVFFVDSALATLNFAISTHFEFINGASPDNVYWITAGDVVLDGGFLLPFLEGAIIDGTVLADGTITATTAIIDASPSLVQGRLWSRSAAVGAITLKGNTVSIP